jgi:hypothetical protein
LSSSERFYDVDLEWNVSDHLEVRVDYRNDVRTLCLEVGKGRRVCDCFADHLGSESWEEIEFEGEVGERVDLEREDFSFVGEREDDRVRDRRARGVGFGGHNELEGRSLTMVRLIVKSNGRRERRSSGIRVSESNVYEVLLVEVVVTVCGSG